MTDVFDRHTARASASVMDRDGENATEDDYYCQ